MFKAALSLAFLAVPFSLACNGNALEGGNGDGGSSGCVGRQCQINTSCPAGSGPTTLTGTVTIPSGLLPLYNARVYIPTGDIPPAPTSGASCDRCDAMMPSDAAASTTTGYDGKFTLTNVPSGSKIPLIIRVGKWRRVVMLDSVADCTTTQLSAGQTRLPRNQTEGNIPKIALTTGMADALECILRGPKLGLDDSEFTLPSGKGRVNLYAGGQASTGTQGTLKYDNSLGGAPLPTASSWWSGAGNPFMSYDLVLFSCEGQQNSSDKPQSARDNLQAYIDAGGRAFASHWHNVWLTSNVSPKPPLASIATFVPNNTDASLGNISAQIDTSWDKGAALADWLELPSVTLPPPPPRGTLSIAQAKASLVTLDSQKSKTWVTYNGKPQYFSFDAPIGAPEANQCGQMVFTDLHLSGATTDVSKGTEFPKGCMSTALSPQEKALIFMLFDLSNCLQPPVG